MSTAVLGFSFSNCLKDIVHGKVPVGAVYGILTGCDPIQSGLPGLLDLVEVYTELNFFEKERVPEYIELVKRLDAYGVFRHPRRYGQLPVRLPMKNFWLDLLAPERGYRQAEGIFQPLPEVPSRQWFPLMATAALDADKTYFIRIASGSGKINGIKLVRQAGGLGLKQAKELVVDRPEFTSTGAWIMALMGATLIHNNYNGNVGPAIVQWEIAS